jgi:hypothetical protein
MLLAKSFLAAILALTIGAYLMDCPEMMTPDEAMQCCDSMPCPSHSPSHNHDAAQDCCKSMSAAHAPFLRPSAHASSQSHVLVVAVIATHSSQSHQLQAPLAAVAPHSHAPPIPTSNLSPLRI